MKKQEDSMLSTYCHDMLHNAESLPKDDSWPFVILVAKSPFVRMFSFFQARKIVNTPHWKRGIACFSGIFPHFLTSPPVSLLGHTARLLPLHDLFALLMEGCHLSLERPIR